MKYTCVLVLWLALGLASLSGATLGVGDPAPKLTVGKWIQGEPIQGFESDKAYIVEFWATWCGPCRASIPHLNQVYTKFKDRGLVVVGQDVFERDEKQVKPFLQQMGTNMTYRVALDDKSENQKGAMAQNWMEAAGQNGIPTAFLINKQGKIAWIGHPMQLDESIIEEVLAGTFTEEKARNFDRAMKLTREVEAAIEGKKWDDAEAKLAEVARLAPQAKGLVQEGRFQLLLGRGNLEEAADLADKMAENQGAPELNQLAWALLTQDGLKGKALETAYTIASRANDLTKGAEPQVLDTLARAAFMKGDKDKAIEWQTKAVGLAERGPLKKQLEGTLSSYKDGKLPSVQ